jgi:hypothetical protein
MPKLPKIQIETCAGGLEQSEKIKAKNLNPPVSLPGRLRARTGGFSLFWSLPVIHKITSRHLG